MSTNTREGVASYEVYERLLLERRQFHYFCCTKGSRRSVTYLVNSYELHFMITHLELLKLDLGKTITRTGASSTKGIPLLMKGMKQLYY